MGRLWAGWKRFGRRVGDVQARLLLTGFYFLVVAPFALGVKRQRARAGTAPVLSMNILGISCYFHDAAAALLRDGQLIAAAEEERFSRKKHDFDFPQRAIEFCLRTGGLAPVELDWVVFFEKPFVKFERLLLTSLKTFPYSHGVFREAMVSWLGDELWIRHLIQRRFGLPAARILFSEHHLSHAASAFFCSPFHEAAILTVDGVGEWTTASLGVGRGT